MRAHDRAAVELFCYAEVAQPDGVTAIMRKLADHWRVTVGLSDDALAAQIGRTRSTFWWIWRGTLPATG